MKIKNVEALEEIFRDENFDELFSEMAILCLKSPTGNPVSRKKNLSTAGVLLNCAKAISDIWEGE